MRTSSRRRSSTYSLADSDADNRETETQRHALRIPSVNSLLCGARREGRRCGSEIWVRRYGSRVWASHLHPLGPAWLRLAVEEVQTLLCTGLIARHARTRDEDAARAPNRSLVVSMSRRCGRRRERSGRTYLTCTASRATTSSSARVTRGGFLPPPIHNAMRKRGETRVGHDCDVRATGFGH